MAPRPRHAGGRPSQRLAAVERPGCWREVLESE